MGKYYFKVMFGSNSRGQDFPYWGGGVWEEYPPPTKNLLIPHHLEPPSRLPPPQVNSYSPPAKVNSSLPTK